MKVPSTTTTTSAATATGTLLLALVPHLALANLDIVTLPATNSASWIREATATLVLGDTPNPVAGDVALWSAIMMDGQDFLQGVTESAESSPWCEKLGSNEWCNFAYMLNSQGTDVGEIVKAAPGSRVRTSYVYNNATLLWGQTVSIDGQVVSSVSTSRGMHGNIFYISIECATGDDCSPAPAHNWEDISITLSAPDPNFRHTGAWDQGATGGEMSSADGGMTWTLGRIEVPYTPITG